jgi:hypothetical protein
METLFLVVCVLAIAGAAWITLGKKKKVTPKVSSGGIRPTEPTDPTKPTTDTQF